ncbi:MAG: hypothetical protein WCF68_21065 [Terriglobales bacterium]
MYPNSLWASAALAVLALPCAVAQQHAFSVRDDIAMNRISDPHVDPHVPGSEIAWPAPDGSAAAVVITRGLVASDTIESRVLLFDLHAIQRALTDVHQPMPQPRTVAVINAVPTAIETDAYAPVIKDVRWSEDSRSLFFLGSNLRGDYELYTVHRDGTGIRRLTRSGTSVDKFDVVGHTVVYDAAEPGPHRVTAGTVINRDAYDITDTRMQAVLFPDEAATQMNRVYHLATLELDNAHTAIHPAPHWRLSQIPYLSPYYPFRASPDGEYLVDLEPPDHVPSNWSGFATLKGYEFLRLIHPDDPRLLQPDNVLRPLAYTLVDLRNGQRTPLVEAPNARSLGYATDASRVAWSHIGRRVLITNTFLPPQQANTDVPSPCAVASVEIASREASCLLPYTPSSNVQDVAFGKDDDEVVILLRETQHEEAIARYSLEADGWKLRDQLKLTEPIDELRFYQHGQRSSVTVSVEQTLNDPPKLWVTDRSGRHRCLWDPNPQLASMAFGEASPYSWKDATGRQWSAILVKPVGYVQGKRYPAVLQMYQYVDAAFVTDGLYPTAFAARELASEGFVVLQIRKQRNTVSEEDPTIHIEGYRSAIDRLDQDGLIDRHHVGVVGFSWTCWYATEVIIREPSLFQAATIADGLDNGYMNYKLFTVGDYDLQEQMTQIRGGAPFGAWLQHWVDTVPDFHVDRVTAPIRIEAINPSSILQEWELFSSLALLHKAVDLIYFPNGSHIHQLPQERLASQQGNVDWMRFWLKGEEDPDPAKAGQYARWRHLRELRDTDAKAAGQVQDNASSPN